MALYLFDNDGTLVLGLGSYVKTFNEVIKQLTGKDICFHLTPEMHGTPDRAILRKNFELASVDYTEGLIDDCFQKFGEIYQASEIQPLPHVRETLELLKYAGDLRGIVTGNIEKFARKRLEIFGLNELLPFGAFGNESYQRSDLVRIALMRAIKYGWDGNRSNTYVVGDTPHDIKGALDNGLVPIGVTTGKYSGELLEQAGAHRVIGNLSELLTL